MAAEMGDDDRALVEGVLAGDRTAIGQAITLVESTLDEHRPRAGAVLEALLPHTGDAHRVGITGVPGVGKSTFIEALGTKLTGRGHRVAVVAVDPSSQRTGGSILGDKTRMPTLAVDDAAFIRPSPSAGTLGGVARATRESILVLEAAGYDVVIVETVGVGQSETVVHGMVDIFVVLMLSGAGDELQGIKKGVLELADLLAVNKADGDNVQKAALAAGDYRRALHLLQPASPHWTPPVHTCSALTGDGLDELWDAIELHRRTLDDAGVRAERREAQQLEWLQSMLRDRLVERFESDPSVIARRAQLEAAVQAGELTPSMAVERLLDEF
ncbi:MAG: methylmalonyl Co-A mutase-associated GTPase MeaB [Acidimicrobiales bacterium]|nr:methylmalonyl Co-A mutase-associated GTPase MeaB [Acidimicrobiales bacterium]